jgi:cytochrome P450
LKFKVPTDDFQADWYSCCTPPAAEASSLFSVRDRTQHQYIRKLLNPYYRKSSIEKYRPLLKPCLEDLQEKLDNAAETGAMVNLADLILMYSFDAIGRITVGC